MGMFLSLLIYNECPQPELLHCQGTLLWRYNEHNGISNHKHFNCLLNLFIQTQINKANLRDLLAATGLVILLKLDSNRRFFSPCDLEISWMTSKNYRAPLLDYIKLCASSKPLGEFKLELLSGNAQIGSKSVIYCPVWPWNLTDDLEKQ